MTESQDGAHLGYGMEEALKEVLGGEGPAPRQTVQELRDRIEAADATAENGSYDAGGYAIAKTVLHFLMRHPEAGDMPADSDHEWPKKANGEPDWNAKPTVTRMGLYDYIKETEPDLYKNTPVFREMTGFMWGWGVNAARRCLEMPPVPNPAIVDRRSRLTRGGSSRG